MKSKIKLSGDSKTDLDILINECTNNNQICFHINRNRYLIEYLKFITGLNIPVMNLLYHYRECISEIPKCVCGDDKKYHCYGYRPTCAKKKCQNIVREDSKKKFCLENYGVEYVTQLESMKEKSKTSCLKKFGVDVSTKSYEIIKKRTERNFKKYGVSDPIILKYIRGNDSDRGIERIQDGLPSDYNVIKSDRNYYEISCPKGHIFEVSKSSVYLKKKNNISICNECNTRVGSNGEQDVYNYISSIYSGKIIRSDRKLIKPFEIDIIIPEFKLCIEFNGDYWHSDRIVNNNYHLNKLNMCLLNGYDLIQIKENDWNLKCDVIKKKLYNIINNIFDINDIIIEDKNLIFDRSWHDSRIIKGMEIFECEDIQPQLIRVGQYNQWDCGYKIYKLQ